MHRVGGSLLLLTAAAVSACAPARYGNGQSGPSISFPAHFAEGTRQPEAGRAPKKVRDAGGTPPAANAALPDPEPLRLARQWDYELAYDRGQVHVISVHARVFSKPVVTARRMGRYAIELWIGHELIDRVRFDFPLLAAEPVRTGPRRPLNQPPSFSAGAVVRRHVLVPASTRATRAVLVDRATGKRQILPWPPDRPLAPPEQSLTHRVPPAHDGVRDAGASMGDG